MVDGGLQGLVLLSVLRGADAIAPVFGQDAQLTQRQAELVRQHDGFGLGVVGDIERVVPVGKEQLAQPARTFIGLQPCCSGLYMLPDRGLAAVLPFDRHIQQGQVTGLLDEFAHRPDDPERLVRVACVVIRVPGQHGVAVAELVAQTFKNFFLCLVGTVVQQRHGNLQIVAHPFLANDAEIHLLLYPTVHQRVDLCVRCAQAQGAVLGQYGLLRFVKGSFSCRGGAVALHSPAGVVSVGGDAKDDTQRMLLARVQGELVLQHTAQNEQRGGGVGAVAPL